jgi:TPP-dependent pyruvate/acetoin dehydrogenase alpha subunit
MKLEAASPSRSPEREDAGDVLTHDDRALLLRYMLLQRLSEERGLALYKQGKVPGSFYDGCGQEAVCVGSAFALGPRDRMCILHRDLGAHFVRGVTRTGTWRTTWVARAASPEAATATCTSATESSAASGW